MATDIETCSACGRPRPTYIADPTCPKGGYCHWTVRSKTAVSVTPPVVFVVLKEGDSHGAPDGTPIGVALSEREARYRKIGRCVRYVPDNLLGSALGIIEHFHTVITAVRQNLAACPPEVREAYASIAAMVAEAAAVAGQAPR